MSSDTQNQIISSQPSFYAVIPAHIRYCKKLEHGAKLLFGEITALTNQYGYAWASNKYFMDAYDVSETTIQNWIRSLKDAGFIDVVIEKKGMTTNRKIYITKYLAEPEIKKIIATPKNLSARHKKNETVDTQKSEPVIIHKQQNTTLEHNNNVVVVAREDALVRKKILSSDVHSYAIRFKKDWTPQEIEDAWVKLNNSSSIIEDHMRYIEGIIHKTRINKLSKTKKERKLCLNIDRKLKAETLEKKPSDKCNEFYSAKDTSERPLAIYARLNGLK